MLVLDLSGGNGYTLRAYAGGLKRALPTSVENVGIIIISAGLQIFTANRLYEGSLALIAALITRSTMPCLGGFAGAGCSMPRMRGTWRGSAAYTRCRGLPRYSHRMHFHIRYAALQRIRLEWLTFQAFYFPCPNPILKLLFLSAQRWRSRRPSQVSSKYSA